MARGWAEMRPELKRWGTRNARALRKLGDYDVDDWLNTVGLRRNASALARTATAAGLVLGGIAVGLAVGMVLAPKSGQESGGPFATAGGRPVRRSSGARRSRRSRSPRRTCRNRGRGRRGAPRRPRQISSSIRVGPSMHSLTVTRKGTASRPSTRRWS